MDVEAIKTLVKARIGLTGDFRDAYLVAIIEGIISELEDIQGINLVKENKNHLMFIVDYAVYRYQNRDTGGELPKHLTFRLKNLYVSGGGKVV